MDSGIGDFGQIASQSYQYAGNHLPPLQQQSMSMQQIQSLPSNIQQNVLPPIGNNRIQPLNVAQPTSYVAPSTTTALATGGTGTTTACTPLVAVLVTVISVIVIGGAIAGIVVAVQISSPSSSSSASSSSGSTPTDSLCEGTACNTDSGVTSSTTSTTEGTTITTTTTTTATTTTTQPIGPDQHSCKGSSGTVILKNKLCDQTEDCPGGTDEDRCIISTDGNHEGNVKVYSLTSNGHFNLCGTADGWDDSKSNAVCVALGFTAAASTTEDITTGLGIKCAGSFNLQEIVQQSAEACTDNKIVKIVCDYTPTCGVPITPTPTLGKIVGGEDADISDSPWQIFLRNDKSMCGGTIVSERWVVTAAHCVDSVPTGNYTNVDIAAGITALSEFFDSNNKYAIDKIVYHPLYDETSLINDIAVIHVTRDFTYSAKIQPACLPLPGRIFSNNADVVATGWGTLSAGGNISLTLQTVTLPLVNLGTCKTNFPDISSRLEDGMICAGLDAGGKDSCQGDSGGPLTTIYESRHYLAGATSWGIGCALPGKPGVYAEIGYYADWIKREMAKPLA